MTARSIGTVLLFVVLLALLALATSDTLVQAGIVGFLLGAGVCGLAAAVALWQSHRRIRRLDDLGQHSRLAELGR